MTRRCMCIFIPNSFGRNARFRTGGCRPDLEAGFVVNSATHTCSTAGKDRDTSAAICCIIQTDLKFALPTLADNLQLRRTGVTTVYHSTWQVGAERNDTSMTSRFQIKSSITAAHMPPDRPVRQDQWPRRGYLTAETCIGNAIQNLLCCCTCRQWSK